MQELQNNSSDLPLSLRGNSSRSSLSTVALLMLKSVEPVVDAYGSPDGSALNQAINDYGFHNTSCSHCAKRDDCSLRFVKTIKRH